MKRLPGLNPLTACLAVNATIILAVFLLSRYIPPVVPLFYGLPQGEEQLASQMSLVYTPLIALFFILFNTIVAQFLVDKFLRSVLKAVYYVITLFSTVTVVKIILLVGSF